MQFMIEVRIQKKPTCELLLTMNASVHGDKHCMSVDIHLESRTRSNN